MEKHDIRHLKMIPSKRGIDMSDEEYAEFRRTCYEQIYLPYEETLAKNALGNLRRKIRIIYRNFSQSFPDDNARNTDPCYQGTALLAYYETVLFENREKAHDDLYGVSGESCIRIPFGSPRLMVVLILTYHQEQTRESLASQCKVHKSSDTRDLRDKWGFVFKRDSQKGNFEYTKRNADGTLVREGRQPVFFLQVDGWQMPAATPSSPYVSAPGPLRKLIRSSARCGLTASTNRVEVDHRIGVAACARLGIAPATISTLSIDNGVAGEQFQMLCKSANDQKREVCDQCLHGAYSAEHHIPVPDTVKNRDDYLDFAPYHAWDNPDNPPCDQCFWANITPQKKAQQFFEETLATFREHERIEPCATT